MADKITIKAAPGRNVRDPNNRNRVLPADGIKVSPTDPYWFLKIQRGDVVVVPAQKPVQPAAAPAAAPASPPAAPVQPQPPVKPAVTGTATQSAE
jgi:Protein of unknown function (DUF2635)